MEENRKYSIREFYIWRRAHERWLKSIMLTPQELTKTRQIADSHHTHDFVTEIGSTAVFVTCKSCSFRHAVFQDWVLQPRRVER